jgi:hypothetical protein
MPTSGVDDSLYCACGNAKLASVSKPLPGVHYCIFGNCVRPFIIEETHS